MCALPSLPGVNPRKLQKLLKSSGLMQALSNLRLEEVPGVIKVELYLSDGTKLVIDNPVVSKISIAGMLILQVQTTEQAVKRVPAGASQASQGLATAQTATTMVDIVTAQLPQAKPVEEKKLFSDEDVELVVQETGCSREEAIKALEETRGDIAEAIMLIRKRRGEK